MATLKKGDRVEYIGSIEEIQGFKGVIEIYNNENNLGVVFDKENSAWFHTLEGRCEENHGRWVYASDLKKIKSSKPKTKKEIEEEYEKLKSENLVNIKRVKELTEKIDEVTKKIENKNNFETAMTEAIIEKGKEIAVDDIRKELLKNVDEYVKEHYGFIPKKIQVVVDEVKKKEMDGIFHKEFENITKIVAKNIPLMLIGPAGSGKNHTLEQVSKALDLDFYFTNAITQEYKLTGFIDANGMYHETEFYKAFTNGGLFFLDEMDASCPESLLILNSAIANGYFDFPVGRKEAHKDFRVVAAANTYGTGADMIYVGRNVLDGATLDRFVVLNFDYDEEVERSLSHNEDLYEFIVALRKAINDSSLRYIVSMRATINSSRLLEIGIDKATVLKNVIIKNMSNDDLNTIIKKIDYSGTWKNELANLMV